MQYTIEKPKTTRFGDIRAGECFCIPSDDSPETIYMFYAGSQDTNCLDIRTGRAFQIDNTKLAVQRATVIGPLEFEIEQ